MSTAPLWLEYRLDKLTFQNGVAIKFPPSARMLYEPDDHVIAIELTPAQRATIKQRIPVRPDSAPTFELRRIEYSMLVNLPAAAGKPGARRTLHFFHPLKKGAGVRLTINDRGELLLRH